MPETGSRPATATFSRSLARQKSTLREYAEALGVALLLALVIRTFVVQAFKIPSGSMKETLQIGDHILVNKFLFGARLEIPFSQQSLGRLPGIRKPRPGDVIVFIPPQDRSLDYIKRVVAVEGQTIEVHGHRVFIDGQPSDPGHIHLHGPPPPDDPRFRVPCGSLAGGTSAANCGPFTVPPGHVFVMGDNREQSFDSRFWGPVPISDVKGKAVVIYWSWDGGDRWVRWERLGHLVD